MQTFALADLTNLDLTAFWQHWFKNATFDQDMPRSNLPRQLEELFWQDTLGQDVVYVEGVSPALNRAPHDKSRPCLDLPHQLE